MTLSAYSFYILGISRGNALQHTSIDISVAPSFVGVSTKLLLTPYDQNNQCQVAATLMGPG